MIVGAVAFLSSFGVNTGVSNFAHLGGLLFGYLFLKTPNMQFDPVAPIRRPVPGLEVAARQEEVSGVSARNTDPAAAPTFTKV